MLSNSSNVKMYDNIVGQSAFKVDYVNTAPILLQGIKNADIGDINKGNTFLSRITLEVSKESKLNVLNNNFGVSTDGLTVYHIFDDSWLQIKPYFAPGQPTDHPAIDVKITSNLFSHYTDGGVSITSVDGKIEISDNYFGIDRTGTIPLNTKKAHPGAGEAINLFVVKADVVIGSEDPLKGNRFAYTAYAIDAAGTHNVKLIRNSFKCISAYDYHLSGPKIPLPQIEIKEETEKYIRGVTVPGATVDIFLSDDCPRCSPYTYIGTLTASATGDWRYDFAIAPGRKIIANG